MKQVKKSGRKLAHNKKQSTPNVWTLIPVPAQTRREVEKLAQMRGKTIGDAIVSMVEAGLAFDTLMSRKDVRVTISNM